MRVRVGQRRMELGRGRPQAEGGVTVRAGRVHHVASFALSISVSVSVSFSIPLSIPLTIPLTISVVVAVSVQHRRPKARVHCAGAGFRPAARRGRLSRVKARLEGRQKKKRLECKGKKRWPAVVVANIVASSCTLSFVFPHTRARAIDREESFLDSWTARAETRIGLADGES